MTIIRAVADDIAAENPTLGQPLSTLTVDSSKLWLKRLHASLDCFDMSRQQKLDYFTKVVGRPITTSKDLTIAEVQAILGAVSIVPKGRTHE